MSSPKSDLNLQHCGQTVGMELIWENKPQTPIALYHLTNILIKESGQNYVRKQQDNQTAQISCIPLVNNESLGLSFELATDSKSYKFKICLV